MSGDPYALMTHYYLQQPLLTKKGKHTHTHPPTQLVKLLVLMLADNFIRCEKWTRLKIGRRGYVNLTLYIKMLHLIIQNNYTIKEYLNLLDAALCVDV